MPVLEKKDRKLVERVIEENKEGFERLAKEEPAKERRRHLIKRKIKEFYRNVFGREKEFTEVEV